jgi:hypothetical protein
VDRPEGCSGLAPESSAAYDPAIHFTFEQSTAHSSKRFDELLSKD